MEPLPHARSFGWQSGALLHPRNNKERRVGHEAPAFQVRGFIFVLYTLFEGDAALARGSVLQLELCRFRYLVY